MGGNVTCAALGFLGCHVLGTGHILRHPTAQGKFRQTQRVGAVGGGLAGGNQLIGGGHVIVDDGSQLHQQILRQIVHLGPVGDVGTHYQLCAGISLAEAVIQPVVVHGFVKMILPAHRRIFYISGGGDAAAV